MTREELNKILILHKLWLHKKETGKRANLHGSDLSYSDLSDCNLSYSDLSCCNLSCSNLSCSNLRDCNLSGSNLSCCNLSCSDLSCCNLSCSNLRDCNLRDCNLSGSNLSCCNLSCSDLSCSNLSCSNLRDCNLSCSDLSQAKGLLSASEWMIENLEKCNEGYIVYKAFDQHFIHPDKWEIRPQSIITEVVNPLPTLDCASGINVASKNWPQLPQRDVWKCLIQWEWLPDVVVPYNTEGKLRCSKLKLLEKISQ